MPSAAVYPRLLGIEVRLSSVAVMLIIVALLAAACRSFEPAPVVVPETIGVIVEQKSLGSTRFSLTLDTGDVVDFDSNQHRQLGGPFPQVGNLLLLGPDWYASAEPVGDCFQIAGWAGNADEGKVRLGSGIELDEAPDSPGSVLAGGPSEFVSLCLDAQGRFVGACQVVGRC